MKYSKILVPTDFSFFSRSAIKKAVEIQALSGAKLTLAHIIDYVPPPYVKPELPALFSSDEMLIENAKIYMDKLIEEEKLIGCNSIIKTGKAGNELLRIISDSESDIVVMSKHKNSGLNRFMGSTTDTVVRNAKCDVLVLHENA